MSQITTHILDTALGKPAAGVRLILSRRAAGESPAQAWFQLGVGVTDDAGRAANLLAAETTLAAGVYQLTFDTGAYHRAVGAASFYPVVEIQFSIDGDGQHYHIPLLLNPFGYSTYRGS